MIATCKRALQTLLLFLTLLGSLSSLQARGYDDGYLSICAFEETIDDLEKTHHDTMSDEELVVLYEASTHLLFQIQEKILQCKVVSLATGYPLYMKDWQRYKRVRNRVERFVRRLCKQNSALPTLGSMEELEEAFFAPKEHNDTYEDSVKAFFKGAGQGAVEAPKNFVKGIGHMLSFGFWFVGEVIDEVRGHPGVNKKINAYKQRVEAFEERYTKNHTSTDNNEMTTQIIDLVVQAYDLAWYIKVAKWEYPKARKKWTKQIEAVSEPLQDEFCLSYKRKDFFERFAKQLAEMSPAQRTKFITHMVTTVLVEALLLNFVCDIAGLGNLDKLGTNSRIGRWLSKTSGGRATFKAIQKVHKALRRRCGKLLRRGMAPRHVRKAQLASRLEQLEYDLFASAERILAKANPTSLEILTTLKTLKKRDIHKIKKLLDRCLLKNGWIRKPLKKGKGFRYLSKVRKDESIRLNFGYKVKLNRKPNIHHQPYMSFSHHGTRDTRIPIIAIKKT